MDYPPLRARALRPGHRPQERPAQRRRDRGTTTTRLRSGRAPGIPEEADRPAPGDKRASSLRILGRASGVNAGARAAWRGEGDSGGGGDEEMGGRGGGGVSVVFGVRLRSRGFCTEVEVLRVTVWP